MDCKHSNWCGAPLCPLDSKVRQAYWFPGEEHCHREDLVVKYDWLSKQFKIARSKICDDWCFSVNMLEVLQLEDINKNLQGLDADKSDDKVWIKQYRLSKRRIRRIVKLEEKPRVGYINKKGHRCLFVGKKCILWRENRNSYYILDHEKKCLKTSKFRDVCEEYVKGLEKIKTKSIYDIRSKKKTKNIKGENVDEEKSEVKHERKIKVKGDQKDHRNSRSHEALRKVRKEKGC